MAGQRPLEWHHVAKSKKAKDLHDQRLTTLDTGSLFS